MEFTVVGIYSILLLLFLIGVGTPIGVSFILSGFIGSMLLLGLDTSFSLLSQVAYYSVAAPTWTALPLFILMGSIAARGGFAKRAYRGFDALSKGLPGSLGIATCFGCAAFGAISGSSIATTAIFGRLALPEMRELKYDKSFSVGCIASAGTFASMIPPSMMFVVYALFTNTSIGRLFFAGIIPGIITAFVYSFSIMYRAKYNKKLAPRPEKEEILTVKERFIEAGKAWPIAVVAIIILGGIYTGTTTPTEAAAVGSIVVLIVGLLERKINKLEQVSSALRESANTTAMLFLINIGALYFSRVITITRLPADITMLINNWDVPRFYILLAILVIYFFLGMIMVPIGIYAMTLPIIMPILTTLGYDPIWFGVITLKLTEIAAITPPVGLNVYAMKGVVSRDISLVDIFNGIWPFLFCDIVVLVFLILFPQISLWLPNLLMG
ncbi:MAG: TRAP transporter large permease [Atribacterota bacterium]